MGGGPKTSKDEFNPLFPPRQCQFIPLLSKRRRANQPDQQTRKGEPQRQHQHRQIPPGFRHRFQEVYKPGNEWAGIPGPDAIRYYEEELAKDDLGPDSEWEYADELRKQLRNFVEMTEDEEYTDEYEEDEYGRDLRWKYQGPASEENQWIYLGELGRGGFGYVRCWKWYPFGDRDPILFAVKDTQNDEFWNDYCSCSPKRFYGTCFMKLRLLYYTVHMGHAGPQRKPDWEEIIHKDVKPATEAVDPCSSGVISPKLDIYALTLSIREAIENSLNIYTADEINTLRKLPGGENYLPYSLDLINLCRAAGSSRTYRRPDIYSLWKTTGDQARKWKRKVMANMRRMETSGAQCYDGMMLLDHDARRRFERDREFRSVFLGEASWRHRNRGVVKFGKEVVRRVKAEENGNGQIRANHGGWIDVEGDRAEKKARICASEGAEA
ncbi:conserved hypothetical protein [Histoplasma capsulatum var. duboisii H88]|uniref:Protein kinase domain-containing protein n=1 Tax=Ajellomyces capsulatus (strain H88) TaxID=544711 RepID=F0UAH2_AJEC8|nr:conserved hypothetical protein [Histoplasma capsulatum var. duboisii H88]